MNDYKQLRKAEYPPLEDLADAIVHMQLGETQFMAEYLEKCMAVKAKYWKDGTIHNPEA